MLCDECQKKHMKCKWFAYGNSQGNCTRVSEQCHCCRKMVVLWRRCDGLPCQQFVEA